MFRELPDERKSHYEKIKFRERLLDEAEKIMKQRRLKMKMN